MKPINYTLVDGEMWVTLCERYIFPSYSQRDLPLEIIHFIATIILAMALQWIEAYTYD